MTMRSFCRGASFLLLVLAFLCNTCIAVHQPGYHPPHAIVPIGWDGIAALSSSSSSATSSSSSSRTIRRADVSSSSSLTLSSSKDLNIAVEYEEMVARTPSFSSSSSSSSSGGATAVGNNNVNKTPPANSFYARRRVDLPDSSPVVPRHQLNSNNNMVSDGEWIMSTDSVSGKITRLFSLGVHRVPHHPSSTTISNDDDDGDDVTRRLYGRRRRHMQDDAAAGAGAAGQNKIKGTESTPLFPGYGTHFAYIYVGTPPQRVSVILDTGSHFTAFPCVGCDCGDHTDKYYDSVGSTTSSVYDCQSCEGSFTCKGQTQCTFSQSYSEGSSWKAFQVQDKVWVGELDLQGSPKNEMDWAIPFMFGCISSQTGLFKTQLADGIMGLSANEYTLPWKLVDRGVMEERVFSLCFASDGGTLTLGGVDQRFLADPGVPIQYTPMTITTGWFTVKLLDIRIGGVSLEIDPSQYNRGKGFIVDSGTTDTYLPSVVAVKFKKIWQDFTKEPYKNRAFYWTVDQFASAPDITFFFENDVNVTVKASAYLEKTSKNDYIPRIYLDEGSGGVLGANFMMDHYIVFDHAHQRVGFADGKCAYRPAGSTDDDGGGKVTQKGPGDVDCLLSFDKVKVKPCDAPACPADGSLDIVQGFETWAYEIIMQPTGNGKPCDIHEEKRMCEIACTLTGPTSIVKTCGGAGAWSQCSASCKQERVVSKWVNLACQEEKVERTCHVGEACPAAAMGLVVQATVSVTVAKSASVKRKLVDERTVVRHAAMGAEGDFWVPAMNDAIGDSVATLVGAEAGNVRVAAMAHRLDSEGTSRQILTEDLQVDVHLTPKVVPKEAVRIRSVLLETAFADALQSAVLAIENSPFKPFEVLSVRVGEPVSILTAGTYEQYDAEKMLHDTAAIQATQYGAGPALRALGLVVLVLGSLFTLLWCLRKKKQMKSRRSNGVTSATAAGNGVGGVSVGGKSGRNAGAGKVMEYQMISTGDGRRFGGEDEDLEDFDRGLQDDVLPSRYRAGSGRGSVLPL